MGKRICIFGASIAFGSGDLEYGGWQNHLKVYFANEGQFQHVFNLAISGRTTDDIINRFENEITVRRSAAPDSEMLAIIAIPSNDTHYKMQNGQKIAEVNADKFKINLDKLKNLAREHSDKFVFVNIPSVDKSKVQPFLEGEYFWDNDTIKKYNEIIKEFCQNENVKLIDVFDVLDKEELLDGLHPNTQGHKKMFERIKGFLIENKLL